MPFHLPDWLAWALLAVAIIGIVVARAERTYLRRSLDRARHDAPTDEATGLLSQRSFVQRMTGEIKRAFRFDGTVWLSVWAVTSGDADVFGRSVAGSIAFPETGFRMGTRLFCVIRPNGDEEEFGALMERIGGVARSQGVTVEHGVSVFPHNAMDIRSLFSHAIERLG